MNLLRNLTGWQLVTLTAVVLGFVLAVLVLAPDVFLIVLGIVAFVVIVVSI